MNVLGLCSYPVEAAATRYRLVQFVEPLAEKRINLTVSPFLDGEKFKRLYQQGNSLRKAAGIWQPVLHRVKESFSIHNFDLLFVQREAALFGPAFFENLFRAAGKIPMVLDLDDATYVRYVSPTYGRVGSFFKFFGKTDNLIRRARVVTCGNRFIAEYVRKKGTEAVVIPTVVDTEKFLPTEKNNEVPIIGWIGTHSTFPLLQSIFPVLQKLAEKHRFILKIVGAGRERIEIDGVEIENKTWRLEDEIGDLQSFDIGLYPIQTLENAPPEWIAGKSGFKAIQYMAVGIPFVMTPVGVCAEMGAPDVTHFEASGGDEWYNALEKLLSDAPLRKKMGESGRKNSLAFYNLPKQTEILARVFRKAC
jgi:glycosyltransferase involved in cell wall biosynthesis